jgi:NPCBM-associated, NEW3 domain of alpha-galactosidase/ABC transporter
MFTMFDKANQCAKSQVMDHIIGSRKEVRAMMPGGLSPQWARWALVAGLMALGGAALLVTPAPGAEPRSEVKDSPGNGRTWADRPERSVSVYTEYSQLTVPVGESVRMDLTVENRGRRGEIVAVRLGAVPAGWKAAVKGGQFAVTGVAVTPDKPRLLTFTAEPEKSLRPGTYTFEVTAATADNAYMLSQPVVVTVEERRAGPGGDLQIGTSYPVLRGPTDSSFEFSLEVSNKSDVDRIVNLAAEGPKGWELTIKPGYESKQITTLRIRGSASQTVALEVKPPRDAQAGEYPLRFRASTERGQAETPLRVVLTGIYKLDAATPGGRLSADAIIGTPTTTTLLVKNTGSAVNRNIKLLGVRAGELEGGVRPGVNRGARARRREAGGGEDYPRRASARRRLLGRSHRRWREVVKESRAPRHCARANDVGLDRRRNDRPRHWRARRPLHLVRSPIEGAVEPVVIQTSGLTKRYGSQRAVDDLTLTVREGEVFGFLGPNGAGKTTTILMLLGL